MSQCKAILDTPAELNEVVCKMQLGSTHYGVTKSLIDGNVSPDYAKILFKKFVSRVLIEVSAYCNRKCVFCPNKSGLRITKSLRQVGMEQNLLSGIVSRLEEIDYNRNIVLHLYNEPMSDPDLANKVAYITSRLDKAAVWFNTNGDYLTHDALVDLAEAKLTKLAVSLYGPNHGEYDKDYLSQAFERIFKAVGQKGEIMHPNSVNMNSRLSFEHNGWKIPISIFASDFNVIGYDRGETIDGFDTSRTSPCPAVFSEFNIAYDGTIVPCCNVHPHEASHSDYVIGKLKDPRDMFEIFANSALKDWRHDLIKFDTYKSPCDSCTRLNYPELQSTAEAALFNDTVSQLLK